MLITRSVLLKMRNFSNKSCRENQNTHFASNNFFFLNPYVYEIMWKNIVQSDRPQMTIWRMRVACWIPMATNEHSEYVILIAFPLQQFLNERALMLRHRYTVCIVLKTTQLSKRVSLKFWV